MTFCIRRFCRSIGSVPRSIGVDYVRFRRSWSIDRLLCRDRSAMLRAIFWNSADRSAGMPRSIGGRSAFLLLFFEIPADRSADVPRSIGDGSVSLVFLCSRMLRFVWFFISIFVPVLKSPVHSQNSSKHIKLEEFTTIQDGKCDIWVSILLTHQYNIL